MYDESKVEKLIVFKIADYFLALPIGDVLKVVNCSSIVNKEILTLGLVQVGRHTIKVLDLHQYLNVETRNFASLQMEDLSFLVITCDRHKQLSAILVDQPPDLLELPHQMMQPLPKYDRQGKGFLDLVSHTAVVSQQDVTKTIFLLDVERVHDSTINNSHPLALKAYSS